jgi:acyl-coenzyme A synthetase/AMP-(fatty) acid ligase
MITSLYQSLCNMETNIADRVALRWYDEEKQGVAEVHYAQYAQDLRRFVAFLRAEYGDVRGKRVAILAHNSYQYVICMYGTVIAGAVAVPLNLGKDWDAISYELGLTEPVCILQDGEFAEREPALAETHGIVCGVVEAEGHIILEAVFHVDGDKVVDIIQHSDLTHCSVSSCVQRSSFPMALRGSGCALSSGTMRLYSGRPRLTPVTNSFTVSCFAGSQ